MQQPSHFAGQQQQPFSGRMNATAPQMPQRTFLPQQPMMLQGQQLATPPGEGHAGPSDAGEGGEAEGNSRTKRKLQFKDRNLWVGGQSVVGRKGEDGEWMEVMCSVM
jgi:hypothetical protein